METENNILDNVEYKEMLAQLEELRNYSQQYKDSDDETDINAKDFNALDMAIKYLKHYYPIKINDYKTKIEYLENKEKQNLLNKEMLMDLLNDYRRIYQIIYKLIENKE